MDNPDLLNGATLAYIGDAIFEVAVRQHVLKSGETHPNQLHQLAIKYVGAKGQAKVMKYWIDSDERLTPEELIMYKRGRNHKASTKAKNATIGEYRQATGFESLMGWLFLTNQEERLSTLIKDALHYIDQLESQGGNV